MMATFVEHAGYSVLAGSIRANWNPEWGPDPDHDDRWMVTYETAVISHWPTESAAWVAHDRAVIRGLCPDKLAVVESVRRG